jgi:hypothetical protein
MLIYASPSGYYAPNFPRNQKKNLERRQNEHQKISSSKLEIIRSPKDRGGIRIKYHLLMNLTLGKKSFGS